jgi:hypothetical protein
MILRENCKRIVQACFPDKDPEDLGLDDLDMLVTLPNCLECCHSSGCSIGALARYEYSLTLDSCCA